MTTHARPICDAPFLPEAAFPFHGGDIFGRFCATLSHGGSNVSCCLPCPLSDWVYSDDFPTRARDSNYVAIVMLILNLFLLLSFAVLPKAQSHRHYLSTGLVVSLVIIAIAFIIPLGSDSDQCYDRITPNDLHSSVACGFTGSLVEIGAMGVVVWILLRSIWMALRIMANFKRTRLFAIIATTLGVGLPLIFLAISLPITGVSYRLGGVCVPNGPTALITWFAWVLFFAGISWIVQVATILYCLWKFAASSIAGASGHTSNNSQSSTIRSEDTTEKGPDEDATATTTHTQSVSPVATDPQTASAATPTAKKRLSRSSLTPKRKRRVAWRKIRNIVLLQWRTIILSFIIVNLCVFFGQAFMTQTFAALAMSGPRGLPPNDLEFVKCLIANRGIKSPCLHFYNGLTEPYAVATLVMAPCVGIIVFLLLIRGSIFRGWWEILRNPQRFVRKSSFASDNSFGAGQRDADVTTEGKEDYEAARDEEMNPVDDNDGGARPDEPETHFDAIGTAS